MAALFESADYSLVLADLYGRVDELRSDYLAAKPWSHIVVKDAFPEDLLDVAARECANIDQSHLVVSHEDRQIKQEAPDGFGPATSRLLEILDGEEFRAFLTKVTGVEEVLDDPSHVMAGIHRTPPGGFTKIHRDFRLHPTTGFYHRINVLVFLNRDWPTEYGGSLELWNSDMSGVGRTVEPLFNTMVLWETDDLTLHGLPDPVQCPPDRMRLSVASYYYTVDPHPEREERRQIGYWEARPGTDPKSIGRLTWQDQLRRLTPRPVRLAARTARDRLRRSSTS